MSTIVLERPAILFACRRGLLYEKQPNGQEISIIAAWDEPQALEVIQEFRGGIYSVAGPLIAVSGGKNIHRSDPKSYHIVVVKGSDLVGCARYERIFRPLRQCWVELGGFAIAPNLRGSRVVLAIIKKAKEMATIFGDTKFYAHASVQYGSSSILRKLGGHTVSQYWDPEYKRNVDVLEIDFQPDSGIEGHNC